MSTDSSSSGNNLARWSLALTVGLVVVLVGIGLLPLLALESTSLRFIIPLITLGVAAVLVVLITTGYRHYLHQFEAQAQKLSEAERAIERRGAEFDALYAMARDFTTIQDLPTLLQKIIERATLLFGVQSGGIYLYDAARGELEMAFSKAVPIPLGSRLHLGEGLAGRVAQSHEPWMVEDYRSWEHRSPQYEGVPFTHVLGTPMLYQGELVGVLIITEIGTSSRKFSEADTRLLSLFAAKAAVAVHTTRLFEEKRARLAELEAVSKISSALRAVQTLDEMLPIFLDEVLALFNIPAGNISLYDPALHQFNRSISRGWFTALDALTPQEREGIPDYVLTTGEVYTAHEFANDPCTPQSIQARIPAGWGGVCVPIRTAHEVVAALSVSLPLPREIQLAEVHLLTALAEIAGNAVHRMRLHEQTEHHLQRLTALRNIDRAITSSFDLRLTLDVFLTEVTSKLHLDAAAVLLLNAREQMLEYAAGRGFRSRAIMRTRARVGEGYAGRVALERRVIHIANLAESKLALQRAALLSDEGFVFYCGVPLLAKGQSKGVLEVFHRAPLEPSPDWFDFLEDLARQAAIAIDNAVLFDALQRSNLELTRAYDSTLAGWAKALDLRHKETEGHTQRVTNLTLRLAGAVGINQAELVHARRGSLLHDIGKMGIPDEILLKPGPLSDDEWVIMRKHPVYAHDMLSSIGFLEPALPIPYFHHEKWEGSGYPLGLKAEAIPLVVRIFTVADVWDALSSKRLYRDAWPREQVREYIEAQAGQHFDPQVVEIFMKMEL